MADEIVNLTVDVDVKGDNKLLTTAAKLSALSAASERLENRTNRLSGAMGAMNYQVTQNSRGVASYSKKLTLLEKVFGKFYKMARMVMFGVIALGIEFAISAISLASVNAAFAVGKFLAQAYNYVMQALAGTVAAVGVAAIGAAAAFKEFQAAQFAFRYKDSKELGSALDQSGSGLRSLYKDATLASMGVQALAGAFTAVSKNSAFTPASKQALKAMADFVQASGDPKNSLQAAGTLIGILQKEKKFTAEAISALEAISPEMKKAYSKGNYKDYKKFLEDLNSGKLAADAGVSGQAGTMAQTLVGQYRTYLAAALSELSDVGTRVLEPIKKAMSEIYFGLERTFRRISGDLVTFGKGPFLSSLVKLTEKIEDFTVVLFRKFLPATEGFWKRTTNFFKGFAIYFREVRDALEPLREGGSIVIDMFGKPIVEIFKQIGKGVKALAEQAVKYKDLFLGFGDAMKSVVTGFFEITRALREVFANALPVINPLVSALGKIMSFIAKIISGLSGAGGSVFSSFMVGMLGLGAFKGRRAARFGRARAGMDNFGYQQVPLKKMIYSGHLMSTMASQGTVQGGSTGLGSLSGNMAYGGISGNMAANAGQAAGAAASAAISPGASALTAAGASLQAAGSALSAAAVGSTLRGGMGGGAVDPRTGRYTRLPSRKPGQSNEDYNRDINRYVTTNRGVTPSALYERGYKTPTLYSGGSGTNIYGRQIGVSQDSTAKTMDAIGMRRMTREQYRASEQRIRAQNREIALGKNSIYSNQRMGAGGYEALFNSPAALDQSAYAQMTRKQKFQSKIRGFTGDLRTVGKSANQGMRSAGRRALGSVFPSIGGNMAGNIGVGGVGANLNTTARGSGFRNLIGRTALGQSFNQFGYQGLKRTLRDQLGFSQAGVATGPFGMGKYKGADRGGNFGRGYRNAKFNFLNEQRAGRIAAGAKFSKLSGLKAGAKFGLSGMNMALGIGTDMFLNSGMGQKMVGDEDAQNSMRTGAALAAVNPLLGLAVGAGLTAMSSKTKKGGLIAGAVSGAAIGGMIAGPLGAAVGGLIGAGLGAFSANRNQKKAVREGMKKVGAAQLSAIAVAAASEGSAGKTTKSREMLASMQTFSKDFAATRKFDDAGDKDGGVAARVKLLQPYIDAGIIDGNALSLATGDKNKDAIAEVEATAKTMNEALGPSFNQFDSIMNSLKQTTGMTSEEIYKLAMERNVDLYDTTLKLNDVTKALGVGMTKTSKQFTDALKDVQIKAMDVFRRFKENKDMKDALQASGDNLRGGDNSTEAFLDYYSKYLDYSNFKNPGTPLLNAIAQAQAFGSGANVGKGTAFGPGGPLSGVVMGAEATGLIGEAQRATASGSATEMTKQLLAMTGEAGFTFENGEGAFKGAESKINALITSAMGGDADATAKVRELEGMLSRGVAFQGKSAQEITSIISSKLFGTGATGGGTSLFGTNLKTEMSGNLDPYKDILSEEAQLMRTEFTQAVRAEFFERTDAPQWWDQSPAWWKNGFEAVLNDQGQIEKLLSIGDTDMSMLGNKGGLKSSNLKNTMGKHNMFNSAVPGNRTVTSSLRNFALGSSNSDHATGHAYDLVGDNLGKYSSLINSAGGFAEFHGSGDARHLHVVPPVGPMGDTATSVLAKMTGSTSGGGGTFNITVNESSTPQVTARAVADEILKIQKNWKQRT